MTEKDKVQKVLSWLERRGTRRNRDGMARFAIPSHKAYGVSMTTMRPLIKRLGKNHELAAALWEADRHETRILAAFIDDPALVTPTQMDRWCRDFDSWAVCDTVCFHLFDRTPRAFRTVDRWASRRDEFVKRGAFALLASLALHDKKANDEEFLRHLPLIEHAASDERNFVKKAVNWALRQIGKRNLALNAAAVIVAQRLSASSEPSARWVGKDALRELTSPVVARRLAKKRDA